MKGPSDALGRPRKQRPARDEALATRNQDFALLALLLIGGAEEPVHVERVAVAAHQLAPERFRWENFDLPSLETTRVSLRADHGRGADVSRDSKNRYALTATGIERAVQVATALFDRTFNSALDVVHFASTQGNDATLSGLVPTTVSSNRPVHRMIRKVRSSEIFKRWREDPLERLDRTEAADLLDCLPDSAPTIWRRRIEEIERTAEFWHAADVRSFARNLADQLIGGLSA